MTKSYKIVHRNNQEGANATVNVKKSMSQLGVYIRARTNNARGTSDRTLKRRLPNIGDTHTIGDYTITVLPDDSNSNRVHRHIKNAVVQNIPQGADHRYSHKSITIAGEVGLNAYINDYRSIINDKIRDIGGLNNKLFKIAVEGYESENPNNILSSGTIFGKFNETLVRVDGILDNLRDSYDDNFIVSKIIIMYRTTPNIDNLIVFGNRNTSRLKEYIKSRLSNRRYKKGELIFPDQKNTKKLIKILKTKKFISPPTTDNCLIHAFFIGLKKREDVLELVKKFVGKHGTLVKTVGNVMKELSIQYSCKINVLEGYMMNQKSYGEEYKKEVDIFIFASHSYAMFSQEDIKKHKLPELKIFEELEETLIIKKEERQRTEYTIGTYDYETYNDSKNKVIPYACGVYFKTEKRDFYKHFWRYQKSTDITNDFIKYIMSSSTPANLKLYAHNGGNFDSWLVIEHVLLHTKYNIENIIVQNGRIINFSIVSYGKKRKRVVFRDSCCFFAGSLANTCKSFPSDISKLEGDVDHRLMNEDNTFVYMDEKKTIKNPKDTLAGGKGVRFYVSKYLKYDCRSLYNCLTQYNTIITKNFGFSAFDCITNASISRKIYMNDFYKPNKAPLYTLNGDIDCELRPWYFGGRNECFQRLGEHKGKFYYFDFTSLYPYCMNAYDFPYGKLVKSNITELPKKAFGLIKVMVRNKKKTKIPFHCIIKDHRLVFPHFDNWTEIICTTEDIKYSLENDLGYEYKYKTLYNYAKKGNIFKNITNKIYKLKIKAQKKGNKALRSTAKIIINSVYGFFGQRLVDKEQIKFYHNKSKYKRIAEYNKYLLSGSLINHKEVGKFDIFKYNSSIESDCVNLPIAMFCTSYARRELHMVMSDIGKEGGKVYYCDTDSVICDIDIHENKRLHDKYIRTGGEKLGELTSEAGKKGGFYSDMILLGCKQYALESSDDVDKFLKFKGINIKGKYDNKTYDHKKKEIIMSGYNSFDGKQKVNHEDFRLISKGYNLICDTLSFSCTDNLLLYKGKGLTKKDSHKRLRMGYTKGNLDKDLNITPLKI